MALCALKALLALKVVSAPLVTAVVARDCLLFVLDELAIQLVDHGINGRIHVFSCRISKEFAAGNVGSRFRHVFVLLHIKDNMDLSDLVVVTIELFKFLMDEFVD